jgi:hypothetical protein
MHFNEKQATHDLDIQLLTQDGIITNPVIVSHINNDDVSHARIWTFEELLKDEDLKRNQLYRTRF